MNKENLTVRVDPELKRKAKAMGLSLTEVITEALSEATSHKRCKACGQTVKAKK